MKLSDRIRERAKRMGKGALLELHPELSGIQVISTSIGGRDEAFPTTTSGANPQSYVVNNWVNKAIDIWQTDIGKLDMVVHELKSDGTLEPIKHDLNDLLEFPHPDISKDEFWGQWAVEMGVNGEYGLEAVQDGNGKYVELWPRISPKVIVRTNASRDFPRIIEYIFNEGTGGKDGKHIPVDEMIFYKFYNPLVPFRGLSPIASLRLSIAIDQKSQEWYLSVFKNGARPDYALIVPEGMTRSEKEEYEKKIKSEHRGTSNANEPMILERGIVDIKPFSFNPVDVGHLKGREFSREEIGAQYGIPDEIMGFGRDTYENFDTADRVKWTDTIQPLVNLRDNELTFFFKDVNKVLSPNQVIKTDLSKIPQLQENTSDKVTQWAQLVEKGYPMNVAFDALRLPFPKVEGGDVGYISAINQPATSAKGFKGRPRITFEPDELETKALPEPETKIQNIPEFGSKDHEDILAARARLTFPFEGEMARRLRKYFQEQQNRVTRALRSVENRTFGRGLHKGEDDIPPISDLFDVDKETAIFVEEFEDIVLASFVTVGESELTSLGIGGELDLTQEVLNDARFILETQARKVNNTTFEDLISLFAEAETAGEGIPSIMERLSAFYGDRKSEFETERIARTTMNATSNSAAFSAWDQSEVVQGKTWISALLPGRTREWHAQAHGQTVGLRMNFDVGGEPMFAPGDPNGSAGNVINCLCTMIPQVIETLSISSYIKRIKYVPSISNR
jgi:HK97 family phage portal protein